MDRQVAFASFVIGMSAVAAGCPAPYINTASESDAGPSDSGPSFVFDAGKAPSPVPDGGNMSSDADAGPLDAGSSLLLDAGMSSPPDAGPLDAGMSSPPGPVLDGGIPSSTIDAGVAPDGSWFDSNAVPLDAGTPVVLRWSQSDAGGFVDAGTMEVSPGDVCGPGGWCWSNQLPEGNALNGVWGGNANDVWAVGLRDTIVHWDGSVWSGISYQTKDDLTGIWGSGLGDIWAVGARGTGGVIIRWNGMGSTIDSAEVPAVLNGVWGDGPDDVWGVGASGMLVHWDGTVLWTVSTGLTDDLLGIWGTSGDDLWAVGRNGTILHWDGAGWVQLALGIADDLHAVWSSGAGDIWVGCDSGPYDDGAVLLPLGWRHMVDDHDRHASPVAVDHKHLFVLGNRPRRRLGRRKPLLPPLGWFVVDEH